MGVGAYSGCVLAGHGQELIVQFEGAVAAPFWRALGYRANGDPVPYAKDRISTTAQVWLRAL